MNDKQLFGVLIRWLGVVVLLQGVRALAVDVMIWTTPSRFGSRPPLLGGQEQIYVTLILVIGLIMIRWPEWVVQLAWFDKPAASNSTTA